MPKNVGVQAKLNSICKIKKTNGSVFSFDQPPFKNKNNEITIVIYKTVHTGANTQSGGLNGGLFKL